MKPYQFLQKHFLLCSLVCVFSIAIIASCKKEDLQSPSHKESTNISSATGDSIPPTVTFTFPKNKDTVFDSITVKVTATDGGGVASVQLKVDGVSLGTKTAAPYNFGWNTKKVLNGTHLLTAKAVDVSGNSKNKSITVNTLNAA